MKRLLFVGLVACRTVDLPQPTTPDLEKTTAKPPIQISATCTQNRPMIVRFYDVGQGLAALVELADGRRVLVDTGDDPSRGEDCRGVCAGWHDRLMRDLSRDIPDRVIDMVWITHQHSDHLGGAVDVLSKFHVKHLVDNGEEPRKLEVRRLHEAAAASGVSLTTIAPGNVRLPIDDGPGSTLRAIVPTHWPVDCSRNPNDCSIGLWVSDCHASILFTGDAERAEEAAFDLQGLPVTLLQVAHHGSDTSTTAAFLERAKPQYAVISSGKPDEGTNARYCHPRKSVVLRLNTAVGGNRTQTISAYEGSCSRPDEHSAWASVASSDHVWLTARDGDVTLKTAGNGSETGLLPGTFERSPP